MKSLLSALSLVLVLSACNAQTSNVKAAKAEKSVKKELTMGAKAKIKVDFEKVIKTEQEWKEELTDEEYHILREKGTERAFTGTDLLNNKKDGTYVCAACELPLFESGTKFKSGTGWPSFYAPIKEGYVAEEEDNKFGMVRTEVLCGRCDGHLGHVFADGPKPTGLRYCINAVSLDFQEKK